MPISGGGKRSTGPFAQWPKQRPLSGLPVRRCRQTDGVPQTCISYPVLLCIHRSNESAAAPASVKPATSGSNTPFAPHEFRLVSFDKLGEPQPLPVGLGNLPLYYDGNGFYSVNGPLNLNAISPRIAIAPPNRDSPPTIRPLAADISGLPSQNPYVSPAHGQNGLNNDAINNGPVTSSNRRNYHCDEPDCTWQSPFQTKQALNRHREVKHLNIRVDCPIPGCEKVGDNGIKRKDNLAAHVLKKHGIVLPRRSRRG
ncbi:hypothetical protein HOY80DRAFT_1081872 [Tuber brumale]|nr:hypothetical protein HOY80DRAFT_1081872 [Tuber brumale]